MKSLSYVVLLAALAPAAYSQSILYTFSGNSSNDAFGRSVSNAGDGNGDGIGGSIDKMGPAARVGHPRGIVGAALYLATDASAYTTGSILRVDGGMARTVGGG